MVEGHTNAVLSVSFSPDGTKLASASEDYTVRLCDVSTGQAIGVPFQGHTNWVTSVSFSPDGTKLASASYDNTVRLWDVSTGQAVGEPFQGHTNWVTSVSFSPDGTKLASGTDDLRWIPTSSLFSTRISGHYGDHVDNFSCLRVGQCAVLAQLSPLSSVSINGASHVFGVNLPLQARMIDGEFETVGDWLGMDRR